LFIVELIKKKCESIHDRDPSDDMTDLSGTQDGPDLGTRGEHFGKDIAQDGLPEHDVHHMEEAGMCVIAKLTLP
jgi:hypothetical protein